MEWAILGAVIAMAVVWLVSVQRRLAAMDENINTAMDQIGVQFSSQFEAVMALLCVMQGYATQESQTLIEDVTSRRRAVTARSTPEEVLCQERIVSEVLGHVAAVAERYPALKADKAYVRGWEAVNSYGKMVQTSRLIYNDSVKQFNRELRWFPRSLWGGLCGFRRREYLDIEEKAGGVRAQTDSSVCSTAFSVREAEKEEHR